MPTKTKLDQFPYFKAFYRCAKILGELDVRQRQRILDLLLLEFKPIEPDYWGKRAAFTPSTITEVPAQNENSVPALSES